MKRERCGPSRQAVRRGLAGRAAREGARAARTPAQGGRERCGREKRGGRGQRAKLSFYLTSQLKMSRLLDVVCGRLNDPFAVCWEQIRVWRCALHKIILSQCHVDKFPIQKRGRACVRSVEIPESEVGTGDQFDSYFWFRRGARSSLPRPP